MQKTLFQSVVNLLSSARRNVIIVSAFVRSETLALLLDGLNPDVNVEIYARWRISDIVAGASDVAVLDVVEQKNADFRVHDALHAKMYIADETALVGSANATDTGLGRSGWNRSNLEILLKCSANLPEIQSILNTLREKSVPPCRFDEKFIQRMQHAAPIVLSNMDDQDKWIPASLPEEVLRISQIEEFTVNDDALQDCYALGIGVGISEERLGEIARNRRIFAILHDVLNQGYYDSLSNDKGAAILMDAFFIQPENAMKKWIILKKWIEKFSENMYISLAKDGSEVVRRGQMLLSDRI